MRFSSGYSLLELLVVLAILGLVAAVATPLVSTSVERMTLNADARLLATRLRALRELALDQQKEIVLTADGAGVLAASNGEEIRLSSGTSIDVIAQRGQISQFTIGADGTPSGRLRLSRGAAALGVTTQSLTGRVVVEGEP